MKRRAFLMAAVGGAAGLALPARTGAQATERLRRIGLLSPFPRGDVEAVQRALRTELVKLGWVDGRTIELLEPQFAEGRNDLLPSLAAELVRRAPDVIVVQSAPATRALMQATSTIPIVMVGVGDPVLYGMVKSYAEPGGNVTGASYLVNESSDKTLQLLKEVAPRIGSVAVFANPTNEGAEPGLKSLLATAGALRVRVQVLEVRKADDFPPAFAAIVKARSESLLLFPEPLLRSRRFAVGEFAAEHRLPLAIVGGSRYLDAGGLFTYGPAFDQYPVLAARYVDRILRGTPPAKLAVEQPSKFELGLNFKVAAALGLPIPPGILARVTEEIR